MHLILNESLIKSEEEIHLEFQKCFSYYLKNFEKGEQYFYERNFGKILGIASVFKHKETRDLYEQGGSMLASCRAHFECDPTSRTEKFLETLFKDHGMRWVK